MNLPDEHADSLAIQTLLESLFQALEDASMRNKAYREAIRTEPNAEHLMTAVQRAWRSMIALSEPEKYSDLRNRAILAVGDHSLAGLAPLGREVQQRAQIWGKA